MRPVKGILLAGGRGTRLYPVTRVIGKQLLPIYNKPMIYYPLTILLLAGVREILIISTPDDLPAMRLLLGDGSAWGIRLEYAAQAEPKGIPEALIIGADFVAGDRVMLMLGDNLVYGQLEFLREAMQRSTDGATIFAYQVSDASQYGVVEFDRHGAAISLEEKPQRPRSSWAVVGLYLYGGDVADRARRLRPSARGEIEITDLNRMYLDEGRLQVQRLGRGVAWFDTGTSENLLEAANFVRAVETRQGLIIGSPEEAAYRMGYCTLKDLEQTVAAMSTSAYRTYLERVLHEAHWESPAPTPGSAPGGDGA